MRRDATECVKSCVHGLKSSNRNGLRPTSHEARKAGWAMRNDGQNDKQKDGQDHVIAGSMHWELGMGRSHVSEILWRCDALRAGLLYNRSLFGTKEEAETFAAKMRDAEPDQMFNVEASTVWN
jgi:hypothetical protein